MSEQPSVYEPEGREFESLRARQNQALAGADSAPPLNISASAKYLGAVRNAIPPSIKGALRVAVVDPARNLIRARKLRKCIEALRRGSFNTENLSALRDAWGNPGFCADLSYVQEVAKLAMECDGPILECGTGLTTIVCGIIAERRKIGLWCLEQDLPWLKEVNKILNDNRISARVMYTPLLEFGDHVWYDTAGLPLPKHFGLVICDGPYVSKDLHPTIHAGWRYGVMPAFAKSMISYDSLILDDVNEPRAPAILERWRKDFGTSHLVIQSPDGDCAIVSA